MIKVILRWILKKLYRVEVTGLEHLDQAGPRALIVANHTSFLDGVLLAAFLPGSLTFAINTQRAKQKRFWPFLVLARLFPMDPVNPLSIKSLIRYVQKDQRAVIFPEGRITVTGSLMKIYDGPGLVADRSQAQVVPVRIDGAQYTPFSRLKGQLRLRWFPRIRLVVLPPRKIEPPAEVRGRDRRKQAGMQLSKIMTEMMFATSERQRTLFDAMLDASSLHGGSHIVFEDIQRQPMSYNALITRAFAIGGRVSRMTGAGENVGVLLPSMANTVAVFMGLQAYARVPAMLNYTAGTKGMLSSCEIAEIRTILTSRRFIELARLGDVAEQLAKKVNLVYLEDLATTISLPAKLRAALYARFATVAYRKTCVQRDPDSPAVILFTSGSEGTPKGVVLSHNNLLANRNQLCARVDFSAQDIILNALPLFHSFGLTAGTLLPLLSGMKTFLYPSPLHYRIVPEMAYEMNATIMFGTNTFLSAYARFAHPYDFYSVRYVFAGAEKLHEETRRVWAEKFGVRIFEGYGATETSPVLAANTPMENRPGTVGRFLPGIEYRLEEVPGVENGRRLHVKGPNVMLGYLLSSQPGVLVPPVSIHGEGWYDTGDIVDIDNDGYIRICGRAKRFAKIGGEMVSLTAVEELVSQCWPDAQHAVVSIPDQQKGELLVLLTTHHQPVRSELQATARRLGVSELNVPRKIIHSGHVPLLGSGKIDYQAVLNLVINNDQGRELRFAG